MHKFFLILSMIVFSAGFVSGQDLEDEAALQGKVLYELEAKDIVLKAQAQNTTEEEVILSYDFILTGTAKNGNELSNTQDGQAKLAANETKILAAARMALGEVKDFEAVLMIYYQDILIDSDTLVYSAEKQKQTAEAESEYEEDVSQEGDYEGQESGFEFGGLLIDNTRTRAGRDLYDLFYAQWEAPAGAGDYYIKLEEFPGRGRTTRLVVWLDDEKIVETNLQPNFDYLERLADYVNARLSRILAQRAEAGENLNNELQGIY
ncbi:MAG: hypothetical protein H6557_32505 [Lewinellaceae bacterium]|nr:hypothetical protein [Phaeodactylibacter sp.]MCB9041366.1 hypothetical protein [Lewinellaceae bacterium]